MESPGVPEAIAPWPAWHWVLCGCGSRFLPEAQVEIAQTISAPKGDHLPGATHIAALLMYGTSVCERISGLQAKVVLFGFVALYFGRTVG